VTDESTRAPESGGRDVGDHDAVDHDDELHAELDDPGGRRGGGNRVAVVIAASVALVIVAIAAFSIGRLSTLGDPTPTQNSAEAGFARDMQVHHIQGVELAMIVRDLTDDPDTRLLAYDIATTQGQQAGQMNGWLNEWGLSQAGSEPSMAWMSRPVAGGGGHQDHATHQPGAPMPGYATPEQVAELRALTGVEAERRFLELMIVHHEGGVDMAEAVLERSSYGVVVALAQSIVDSQKAEIDLMTQMLAERS
jgi:uncharacterized protein (DUF305 family)